MVLKYFTDGDFRFHSYILKEKVRQCKEKVQTLTESHDLHQSGVATFFISRRNNVGNRSHGMGEEFPCGFSQRKGLQGEE